MRDATAARTRLGRAAPRRKSAQPASTGSPLMADEADDMLALVERSMASAQSALSRRVVNRKGEWRARWTGRCKRQRATGGTETPAAQAAAMAERGGRRPPPSPPPH